MIFSQVQVFARVRPHLDWRPTLSNCEVPLILRALDIHIYVFLSQQCCHLIVNFESFNVTLITICRPLQVDIRLAVKRITVVFLKRSKPLKLRSLLENEYFNFNYERGSKIPINKYSNYDTFVNSHLCF